MHTTGLARHPSRALGGSENKQLVRRRAHHVPTLAGSTAPDPRPGELRRATEVSTTRTRRGSPGGEDADLDDVADIAADLYQGLLDQHT